MLRDMFDKEFRTPADPPRVDIIDVTAEEFYGKGYAVREGGSKKQRKQIERKKDSVVQLDFPGQSTL
jgi:hypothetical protein